MMQQQYDDLHQEGV